MSTFLHRLRSSLPSKGFTLTELVVVIAIVTVLTGVFLTQQQQFDSTTLLRSLSYSMALSIRQAQTYGVSVRSFEGTFAEAHGIQFVQGLSEYYLFADIDPLPNGDRMRDALNGSEDVETFGLTGQKFTISDFCALPVGTGQSERCTDQIDSLTILFIRPNPDACIATSYSPTACVAGDPGEKYQSARIQLQGPGGATRSVTIRNTGQISVGKLGS